MKDTTMKIARNANWDQMEQDVVERIRYLKLICQKLDAGKPLNDAIANDLIMPNIRLLAEFCESVKCEEGSE